MELTRLLPWLTELMQPLVMRRPLSGPGQSPALLGLSRRADSACVSPLLGTYWPVRPEMCQFLRRNQILAQASEFPRLSRSIYSWNISWELGPSSSPLPAIPDDAIRRSRSLGASYRRAADLAAPHQEQASLHRRLDRCRACSACHTNSPDLWKPFRVCGIM